MTHVREDLTCEALVARAKASNRCYTARWSDASIDLFDDWSELCGVRRSPLTQPSSLTLTLAPPPSSQTSVDYLQHWAAGLVCKAMKAAKIHAWVGDNGDGWCENCNGVWIVASDSGGGAPPRHPCVPP